MKQPILITGAHRSGKSYTVKGMNLGKWFNIIHEPLNPDGGPGWIGIENLYYFAFIDKSNSDQFKKEYYKTLDLYKYRIIKQLRYISNLSDVTRFTKGILSSLRYKLNNERPLLDDPFAVFSAEWFYKEFNADIIIMIRHPASFVSSLKLLNYSFQFSHLLNQQNLMEHKLKKYKSELIEFTNKEKSIVEQGELLWRIIYDIVNQFRNRYHDEWKFIRFEDVVIHPEDVYKDIYGYLGISNYTDYIKNIKPRLSEAVDKEDKEVKMIRNNNKTINYYSISDHLNNYKKILTDLEIAYVKERSKNIWDKYYDESDWS